MIIYILLIEKKDYNKKIKWTYKLMKRKRRKKKRKKIFSHIKGIQYVIFCLFLVYFKISFFCHLCHCMQWNPCIFMLFVDYTTASSMISHFSTRYPKVCNTLCFSSDFKTTGNVIRHRSFIIKTAQRSIVKWNLKKMLSLPTKTFILLWSFLQKFVLELYRKK